MAKDKRRFMTRPAWLSPSLTTKLLPLESDHTTVSCDFPQRTASPQALWRTTMGRRDQGWNVCHAIGSLLSPEHAHPQRPKELRGPVSGLAERHCDKHIARYSCLPMLEAQWLRRYRAA